MVETFRQFSIQDCFLDIETTGLSHYYDEVTLVVGMYDGQDVNTITVSLRLLPIHLDRRYLLRRLGYSGGLKEIEHRFRIRRTESFESEAMPS
jgi:uncharacterized protein YprB with RNaseH-like and TPR domain